MVKLYMENGKDMFKRLPITLSKAEPKRIVNLVEEFEKLRKRPLGWEFL